MIPIRDLNPTCRRPLFTYGLILVNVLVFVWELGFSYTERLEIFLQFAVVPAHLWAAPFTPEAFLDVMRSMFFHGDWLHLLANMLYLYLFGDNVEDRFGGILFLLLYFASGFAATYAQVWMDPDSTIPLVGASGAVAGVLGSYLVLYPGVRVRGIVPLGFFALFAEWPAIAVLALWFLYQLINVFVQLGVRTGEDVGGIALFAHIGGFVFGALLTLLFIWIMPQPPGDKRCQLLYDRAARA